MADEKSVIANNLKAFTFLDKLKLMYHILSYHQLTTSPDTRPCSLQWILKQLEEQQGVITEEELEANLIVLRLDNLPELIRAGINIQTLDSQGRSYLELAEQIPDEDTKNRFKEILTGSPSLEDSSEGDSIKNDSPKMTM